MLTDEQITRSLQSAGCAGVVRMSFESGPYCIDRPTIKARRFAEQIESAATAPLLARIAGLEKLCDETYVKQGADAYNNACDEMERWQKQRKADGKEVGTTGSLCDGIAWLYLHVSKLEQQLDVMAKNTEAQAHASVMREIELTEKVEKLTRQLAEARKDAERYQKIIAVCESDGFGYWLPEICLKEGNLPPSKQESDAAIDAALKEQT